MTTSTSVRRGRGRRPAGEVRSRVLQAAARILLEDGIDAVTFDRVAAVAGSSKMTLYKWWPSRGALAAEAYFAASEPALDFSDTGDIRTDLITQLTSFIRLLTVGGAARPIAELIGSAQTDPELAAAWSTHYSRPRRALAKERLLIAQRAGQLGASADLDVIVDQLWGACYNRLMIPDNPLDDAYAERLVDQALFGAAPPTGNRLESGVNR